jgi:hypothetical protein
VARKLTPPRVPALGRRRMQTPQELPKAPGSLQRDASKLGSRKDFHIKSHETSEAKQMRRLALIRGLSQSKVTPSETVVVRGTAAEHAAARHLQAAFRGLQCRRVRKAQYVSLSMKLYFALVDGHDEVDAQGSHHITSHDSLGPSPAPPSRPPAPPPHPWPHSARTHHCTLQSVLAVSRAHCGCAAAGGRTGGGGGGVGM